MAYRIRRANGGDLPGVISLLKQVLDIHYNIRPALYKQGATNYTNEELLEIFADDGRPVFVYDSDGIKGYAFCEMRDYSGHEGLKPIKSLYIDDLCVDSECRREHVGRALFEYVKGYAKDNGCYNVTLCVWEGNDSARAFYDAMGMGVQKTVMEAIL